MDLGPGILQAVRDTISDPIRSVGGTAGEPLPSVLFCRRVSEEYERYYRTKHAGPMMALPSGRELLAAGLRTYMFRGWGQAFSAYWLSTVWVPSGAYLSGATINSQAMAAFLQSDIDALLVSRSVSSIEDFAQRIASILHTYTTGLLVQAVLAPPAGTKTEIVQ